MQRNLKESKKAKIPAKEKNTEIIPPAPAKAKAREKGARQGKEVPLGRGKNDLYRLTTTGGITPHAKVSIKSDTRTAGTVG